MTDTLRKTFLLLLLAAVTIGAWVVPPDPAARRYVEDGLQRSLASFAAARTIGAVLSVAQGTQVAAQPAGVGVVLAPGQALKPINELVEQFAALMLAASVAFGVQLLLASIGAHWVVSALLTAALVGWVALRWARPAPVAQSLPARAQRWLAPVLAALLLARFAVPAMAAGNEALYRFFMADQYTSAQATLTQTGQAVPALAQGDGQAALNDSWLDRLKGGRLPAWVPDVGKKLEQLQQSASRAVEQMVRLIALFLLQTLLLPLFFLWLLRWLCAVLLRP